MAIRAKVGGTLWSRSFGECLKETALVQYANGGFSIANGLSRRLRGLHD
jgi:hypothetical protein